MTAPTGEVRRAAAARGGRRWLLPLAALLAISGNGAGGGQLAQVKSVYILPMASGFDQYLANHLASRSVFDVVTDPRRADALFTDQIGPAFEARLEEMYRLPAEEKAPEEGVAEPGKEGAEPAPAAAVEEDKEEKVRSSSFGRGRWNVFLVGRDSRLVLWSVHHQPKDSSAKQMDRAAGQVVDRLRESLALK